MGDMNLSKCHIVYIWCLCLCVGMNVKFLGKY